MKLTGCLVLAAALFLGCLASAEAATEVKMTGDVRIHANFWSKMQYTGWNYNGSQTSDSMTIYERLRVRTDFIANESLKFRLGIKTGDVPWGSGTFTVDNPAVSIQVYQAFMQFKLPGTDVEFTVGMQDMDLPLSAGWLDANPVMGGCRAAAAIVKVPVVDQFKIIAGFTRLVDSNKDFDPTTTQKSDEFDGYFMALPITVEGFQATPWGMISVAGRDTAYNKVWVGNGGYSNETLANNLLSAGSMGSSTSFKNSQNVYWWIGSTFAVTALDPFKFYADVMYGSGNDNDRSRNKRAGLFFDVAAEYTGFDMFTPQLTFWYSTGEDSSITNGSERMPVVVNYWSPSNSFLFDGDQAFSNGFTNINAVGSWGFVAALDKISFVQDLTHRLTFSYARGTNSPAGLRKANALQGTGNYVQIGRDLTDKESVLAINLDTKYNIYQNLAAILETGWSHGDFQTSVWGHRMANATRNGDAIKVAVGLQYKF